MTVKDKVNNQNISNTETCQTILNTAPVVQEVNFSTKTTNSITVTARATDTENDALTYTMYVSTNGLSWVAGGTVSDLEENTVTLTTNGLTQYRNYYVKVRATETNTTQKLYGEKSYINQIRTY